MQASANLCPYSTLGVQANASDKEIKQAYRQLVLQVGRGRTCVLQLQVLAGCTFRRAAVFSRASSIAETTATPPPSSLSACACCLPCVLMVYL
jgi:hypothetical protein